MSKLLYGEDGEQNIVAIEPLENQNIVKIFKREEGELTDYFQPFQWFLYLPHTEPLLDSYENLKVTKLNGNNHYNRLVETNDRDVFLHLKYNARDVFVPFEHSQYMLQTGKTLFKGMDEEDLLVMYFDIETITKEGYEFPNSQREEDEVVIISIRTSNGEEYVLHQSEEMNEKMLLQEFYFMVHEINPDVLCNHNIFNFDLPYLEDRFHLYGLEFCIGRNNSEPVSFTTSIKFADRAMEYTNYHVFGRHVIDTMFLAQYADVTSRNMPSYRLKDLVKYLDKASKDRVYIEGEDISDTWKNKHPKYTREDLINYALDDVREAETLYKEWSGAYFKLTPMIPMSYQNVFRYGTGNEVEYVFLREYYKQKHSYPKNTEEGKVPGGYAGVFKFGVFKDKIVYIDGKSLYPTLAKELKIHPKKDELGLFQKILDELIQTRYAIKDKIKKYEDNPPLKKKQKALDASIKIFLNTMAYGFVASPWNAFADYDEASRITLGGQAWAKRLIEMVRSDGGTVLKWDTDGGAIIPPENRKEDIDGYCEELTARMDDGVIIENDGEFDGIIPFDGKSYAMLEKDGNIKIKGNSLIGRSIEGFGTQLIESFITELFKENYYSCVDIYNYWKKRINKRILEPNEVSKRSNLNMTLQEYKNRNLAGDTPTLAQYELALNAKREYNKGDVISYYIKEFPYIIKEVYGKPQIRKKKCRNYEAAELLENYNYDIETDFYLDRLDDMIRKFMILGEDKFYSLFPDIKIYATDRKRYKRITGKDWQSRNLNK